MRKKKMMAGLDPRELLELALLLIAVGALSGFLAGLFGIGGGAILVPVFYECFRLAGVPLEVRMPLCIGTSLAIIIPTSLSSFRAHYRRGAVDMEILKRWWLPIMIGVAAGSVTARFAPERLFKIVFVMVAWSAAARLLLARLMARPSNMLVLDEPTVSLDAASVGRFADMVRGHLAQGGAALIATHIDLGLDAQVLDLTPYRARATPAARPAGFNEAFA